MLLPANAVCPTQHWLRSCLLHASQALNRRTGTQWGCFRNNRGCLAYDAIAFRACTMRHVYLSPRVKKGWKRRENRGFCLRESRVGGRRFLHTCKSGVAREALSGTAQHEHAGAALPVQVTIHSCDLPPEPTSQWTRNSISPRCHPIFRIAFWFTLFYCLHKTFLKVDWSMSEKLLQHAGEEVMFQI